jgi:hypothetical protein
LKPLAKLKRVSNAADINKHLLRAEKAVTHFSPLLKVKSGIQVRAI